ncbi:MAG TPA: YgiT-type zinc finger protein [Acidobacteriota bacterium]|nr:YgiT-type zinc finger protein [Acidobacteriota bacterium]
MKCVICKIGEVTKSSVQVEVKVGYDHLLTTVEAEKCVECGEAYYSAEALRQLERLRDEFARKEIVPRSVGTVYQIP